MLASGDIVGVVVPATDVGTGINLSCIVNVEVAVVIIGRCAFSSTFGIKFESDIAVECHSERNTGRATGYTSIATLNVSVNHSERVIGAVGPTGGNHLIIEVDIEHRAFS